MKTSHRGFEIFLSVLITDKCPKSRALFSVFPNIVSQVLPHSLKIAFCDILLFIHIFVS